MRDVIMLVDAMNLFIRHFVVNPTASNNGAHVGGFVGFLGAIRTLSERLNPKKIVVVWESGGSPRRRRIFPDYKKGRRPQRLNRNNEDIPNTVSNHDQQIMLTIEALRHVPVSQIYIADCEADDVIGYLAKYKFRDEKCVIVSSDKDLYQLLNSNVSQWSLGQKMLITPEVVLEKFGVSSNNFCVARCFVGDNSDGIPGVERAGFKTLSKYFTSLREHVDLSVEDIVEEASKRVTNKSPALFNNIVSEMSTAKRNWSLMYLDTKNLSGDQIQKINDTLETSTPNKNKMALIRVLLREGIQTFDVDTFFMSLKTLG
jgi:DNA polymerase-1